MKKWCNEWCSEVPDNIFIVNVRRNVDLQVVDDSGNTL